MKKRLLKLIECKKCQQDFKLHIFKEENNEIKDGLLVCPQCNNYYSIVNFIPRILPKKFYYNSKFELFYQQQIKKIVKNYRYEEDKDLLKNLKQDNIKFFGHEWVHFDRHGFDDHVYNEKFEKQIFHEKTLLKSKSLKNKLVLDAGCGNGRYTYQALRCGADSCWF